MSKSSIFIYVQESFQHQVSTILIVLKNTHLLLFMPVTYNQYLLDVNVLVNFLPVVASDRTFFFLINGPKIMSKVAWCEGKQSEEGIEEAEKNSFSIIFID